MADRYHTPGGWTVNPCPSRTVTGFPPPGRMPSISGISIRATVRKCL
jgi:hypothetical protein